MFLFSLDENAAGALLAGTAVMADPGLAEDLLAEAAGPILAFPVILGELLAALVGESMRGRAQAEDWFARFDVPSQVSHLLVGQGAMSSEENQKIGILQAFQAGNVVFHAGIDGAILGIDGEEDGALEAVMPGQDFGQLRQCFLGAILSFAADEDDVLALAWAVGAVEDDPRFLGLDRSSEETDDHGQKRERLCRHRNAFRWFALCEAKKHT